MSSYNLGIGAAVFAGPLLVALLYGALGAAGMVYLFAALYLVAGLFALALRGTQPGFDGVPATVADNPAATARPLAAATN